MTIRDSLAPDHSASDGRSESRNAGRWGQLDIPGRPKVGHIGR